MLYEFELGRNAAEATKREGAVDHSTVTGNFVLLQEPRRLGKMK